VATRNGQWCAELIRLGGGIRQKYDVPRSDADEAIDQTKITKYWKMIDELSEVETLDTVAAVLWSVHPLEGYGIYERVYSALEQLDELVLGEAVAAVLPKWLERHGDHHNIENAVTSVLYMPTARSACMQGTQSWSPPESALVIVAMTGWTRDNSERESVLIGLGGAVPEFALDPIPAEWPADWRAAAHSFRADGSVNLAWSDERHLSANFDRVFAVMELAHGARWRDVADFLNIIFARRVEELPAFVCALHALPESRRERIMEAVELSSPRAARRLRDGA